MRVKKTSQWHEDALIKVDRISWILSPPMPTTKDGITIVPGEDPKVWVSREDDPEDWHVQVNKQFEFGIIYYVLGFLSFYSTIFHHLLGYI